MLTPGILESEKCISSELSIETIFQGRGSKKVRNINTFLISHICKKNSKM